MKTERNRKHTKTDEAHVKIDQDVEEGDGEEKQKQTFYSFLKLIEMVTITDDEDNDDRQLATTKKNDDDEMGRQLLLDTWKQRVNKDKCKEKYILHSREKLIAYQILYPLFVYFTPF